MRYIIYKITNNINNKIYIGKHKTERLDDDYFGSGKILKQAIKKYGKENFTFHLEFELHNEEEMNLLEKFVVNMEFLQRNDVYNLKTGGEGGQMFGEKNPRYGKHHSEESKQKMSDSKKGSIPWNKGLTGIFVGDNNPFYGKHHNLETRKILSELRKGKHISEETKQKISEAFSGEKHWNYGKNASEETRRKMSEAHIGRKLSEETKQKMSEARKGEKNPNYGKHPSEETRRKILKTRIKFPVVQYTLDFKFVAEYKSISEAERKTGVEKTNISSCCKGKYYQANGYIWVYKDSICYFF